MTHTGWPTLLNCARIALLSLLTFFCTNTTASQTLVGKTAASPEITVHYTLTDFGFNAPLKLSGVDGTYSVRLNLPRHLETTSALLHLNYRHSDTLLEGLSHINVKIDGKHITTLPIRKDNAGKLLEESLELPAQWLDPDSEINFQLIGHYSMACENPRHPNLWAEISNTTSLQLVTRQKTLNDRLDDLPEPFFNQRSNRPLEIAFVLPTSPDEAMLEAAGIVASWFGALADHRGAFFPVFHATLPASGHAVVLAAGGNPIPNLQLADTNVPEVAIHRHPSDPASRLLIIRGPDSAATRQAALSLVLADRALTGPRASVTELNVPAPREPYDAPRWVPADKPVQFGQLTSSGPLQINGFSPDLIRVGVRFPPDLYDPDGDGIPVKLHYHYTPRPKSTDSRLLTSLNGISVAAIELDSADNPLGFSSKIRTTLDPDQQGAWDSSSLTLPVNTLSANSELAFYFYYDYLTRGECKDVPTDAVAGRIDPTSTLDISHLPRFIALPDMAAFANAGFPFSKFADLSQTAVVIRQDASLEEHSAYLTLMGSISASTGYPATHVKVTNPGQLESLNDKDILIIAAGDMKANLGVWHNLMPKPASTSGDNSIAGWLRQQFDPPPPGTSIAPAKVILTGFESPLSSGRSVIVITASQPGQISLATKALIDREIIRDIKGSMVDFDANHVYTLDDTTHYHNGNLGPMQSAVIWFTKHPLLLAGLALLVAFTLGILMYVSLRARAELRLKEQNRH